jgi:hypothetical protein
LSPAFISPLQFVFGERFWCQAVGTWGQGFTIVVREVIFYTGARGISLGHQPVPDFYGNTARKYCYAPVPSARLVQPVTVRQRYGSSRKRVPVTVRLRVYGFPSGFLKADRHHSKIMSTMARLVPLTCQGARVATWRCSGTCREDGHEPALS